ncbi:four helix bundle protein [Winogradskyella ursingii]|nr:four helix bundle protein [Winogradskyella ursingii]
MGSSFELETQLIIANKRQYILVNKLKTLESKIAEF